MLKTAGELAPEAKSRVVKLLFQEYTIFNSSPLIIYQISMYVPWYVHCPRSMDSQIIIAHVRIYLYNAVKILAKSLFKIVFNLYLTYVQTYFRVRSRCIKPSIHSDQLHFSRTQKSIFAAAKLYTISIKQHSKQRAVDIRARYPDRSVRETVPSHLLEEALAYATEPSRTHGSRARGA